jgi:hypothetical protein
MIHSFASVFDTGNESFANVNDTGNACIASALLIHYQNICQFARAFKGTVIKELSNYNKTLRFDGVFDVS